MTKIAWDRKTVSVVLLAVVLPVSLVVAFRLLGGGTRISENVTLDPVVWTFQRPNQSVDIYDKLNATYVGDGLSANMYITMGKYHENALAYDDNDHLSMLMVVNATTSIDGFVESVHIVFHKDQKSKVDWLRTELQLENLSLEALEDGYRWKTQAYIKLACVNHTSSVYAKATAEWSLLTANTQSHQMEITYEITYYNGTAYNRVIQPFQLNIVGREET